MTDERDEYADDVCRLTRVVTHRRSRYDYEQCQQTSEQRDQQCEINMSQLTRAHQCSIDPIVDTCEDN
jgi:hypothetical protein